jgi:hypothetical protein
VSFCQRVPHRAMGRSGRDRSRPDWGARSPHWICVTEQVANRSMW